MIPNSVTSSGPGLASCGGMSQGSGGAPRPVDRPGARKAGDESGHYKLGDQLLGADRVSKYRVTCFHSAARHGGRSMQ